MATNWTVTRLVNFAPSPAFGISAPPGMNKILQASGAFSEVPNSLNPDGSTTGNGRPGKMRTAFILTNSDLRQTIADDALLNFSAPCPIPFQSPPITVAEVTDTHYGVGTPLDLSTFTPVINVTPLASAAGEDINYAFDAKPYIVYNQQTLSVNRVPGAVAGTEVTYNDEIVAVPPFMIFQFGTVALEGDDPLPGSFMVEIDWSHSIAS
jgi:hypothetical protein